MKRIKWISAFVEEILIERLDIEIDKVPKRDNFDKTRVPGLYTLTMYVIIYTIDTTALKRKKHEGISES